MKTTAFINGKELTFATITNATAKNFPMDGDDGKPLTQKKFNERLVVASLAAGGHDDAQAIFDEFPYFSAGGNDFDLAFDEALTVNGLKRAAGATQEGKETPEPAAEPVSE